MLSFHLCFGQIVYGIYIRLVCPFSWFGSQQKKKKHIFAHK